MNKTMIDKNQNSKSVNNHYTWYYLAHRFCVNKPRTKEQIQLKRALARRNKPEALYLIQLESGIEVLRKINLPFFSIKSNYT